MLSGLPPSSYFLLGHWQGDLSQTSRFDKCPLLLINFHPWAKKSTSASPPSIPGYHMHCSVASSGWRHPHIHTLRYSKREKWQMLPAKKEDTFWPIEGVLCPLVRFVVPWTCTLLRTVRRLDNKRKKVCLIQTRKYCHLWHEEASCSILQDLCWARS